MKLRHLLTLAAGIFALSLSASAQLFLGSDDFNSGSTSAWDYNFRIAGSGTSNGLLSFANNRLEFSKSSGAGSYFLGWNNDANAGTTVANTASFSSSWVMNLTATNTLSGLGSGEYATLGFEITNDAGQYSALMLSATDSGNFVRAEGSGFTAVNASTADNTDVTLRLTWDASAQSLAAAYSFDGSSYTSVATFYPLSEWSGGTTSNGFYFEVFGNSNFASAVSGTDVYADNFSVSAIPEPSTYAALAGLGALGVALWRRRAKSAV